MSKRCRARLSPEDSPVYYGRCDHERGHHGPHWLERGMDDVYWRAVVLPTEDTTVSILTRRVTKGPEDE